MKLNLFLKALLYFGLVTGACRAMAQDHRDGMENTERIERLEQSNRDLRKDLWTLQQRVDRIENYLSGSNPPAAQPRTHYCSLIDTGYKETFLGSGTTAIDAEFSARKACEKSHNAVYCQGAVKCDATDPRTVTAVCIVTDTGYRENFRGEGPTVVAAEAKARMSCQASHNAVYCGAAPARCDSATN